MKRLLLGLITFAVFGNTALPQSAAPSGVPASIDLKAIDGAVNPCDNFYQYACGNWNNSNPVPDQYARWGRFDELLQRNQETLRKILEDSAAHEDRSSVDQKIGAYYQACMDEATVNKLGPKPIQPEIVRIMALKDKEELAGEVAILQKQNVDVFFDFGSSPDEDNAKMEIAEADQGGLGLPDRDYYFRQDPKSKQTREEYVQHIAKMFQLLGDDAATARAKADKVMKIEIGLASASLSRVDRRDPEKLHHKMALAEFEQLFPDFRTKTYLAEIHTPPFTRMNVAVPDFFKELRNVIDETPLYDLQNYLVWHYASSYAADLSDPIVQENFAFYGHYLTGAKQMQPRWKRCVQSTDNNLGEALGQKYVSVAFAGASKQKTRELVAQIEHEMEIDINSLAWMSDATKQQALTKLRGVTNKIGYPDKWKTYATVHVTPDDFVADVRSARGYAVDRDIAKIGKLVDRTEWGMTPPTVNAYYSPSQNNINFPAGILQFPFYTATRDQAVNYGAIGAVVGHELTHGFDDQGRQFDADGNLRDWWTKQDEQEFKKRADCIAAEYQKFSPIPNVHLNGKLTLGENGADNGGVRLAYMALMDSLQKHTVEDEKIDGYTPQQRFFLGYAQLWCQNTRPEEALRRAQTDPHSPGEFRVNGVVQNMPEFGQAFGCTASQPMMTSNACRVW